MQHKLSGGLANIMFMQPMRWARERCSFVLRIIMNDRPGYILISLLIVLPPFSES